MREETQQQPPRQPQQPWQLQRGKYGRRVAVVGIAALAVVAVILTLIGKPLGAKGLPPGTHVPPFAVPTAQGQVEGDADIAVKSNEGERGRVPACRERGAGIFNVCQLYERRPLVLALFIEGGGCEHALAQMRSLSRSFPGVQMAAVQVGGERGALRRLVRRRRIGYPVGFDRRGDLVGLYAMETCPQIDFIYPGGVVQSRALLGDPSTATLRRRVAALAAAAAARERGRLR